MSEKHFDSVVIGGGSAALAFARCAAGLGARVALIERDKLGGTCVNRGCVPKKLLWDSGWRRVKSRHLRHAFHETASDFAGLQRDIASKLETIRKSYADDLQDRDITLVRGTATVEAGRAHVNGTDYVAPHIVIATGARPSTMQGVDGSGLAQTSDDALHWPDLPRRVILLGGGYIGCELASIFSAFGVEVALVETGERLLNRFTEPLAGAAEEVLRARGVSIHLDSRPRRITREGGDLILHLGEDGPVSADRIIAAVGRTPNVAELGPVSDRLERGRNGALAVNARFETNVGGVFAIGDAADRLPLTPVATRDGETLARMLHGQEPVEPIDLGLVASAAFVMPPVAQVGAVNGASLRSGQGQDLAAGALVADGHWSARTYRRIVADDAGRVTGAALMAETAADMIAPFAALLAAARGETGVSSATGVHPTFGEETIGR